MEFGQKVQNYKKLEYCGRLMPALNSSWSAEENFKFNTLSLPYLSSSAIASLSECEQVYVNLRKFTHICASLCDSARIYAILRESVRDYMNLRAIMRICVRLRESARDCASLCKSARVWASLR